MQIDPSKLLRDFLGNEIATAPDAPSLSLRDVIASALMNRQDNDERSSVADVLKRGKLAERVVMAEGEIELTPEDVTLIRARIGKQFATSPLIILQAYRDLGGDEV